MSKPVFFLTRHALWTLRDIHAYSAARWGRDVADRYVSDLYAAFRRVAQQPDSGKGRHARSFPFSMFSVGKHFVVYDKIERGVVILALLHQKRDLETIIADFTPEFLAEIEAIKKRTKQS